METALIAVLAFFASMLTFFSGFGLGTLMLPVFCIIYPVEIAVLLNAIIHLLNNCFKFLLIYRSIQWNYSLKFSLFAIPSAVLGSYVFNEWLEEEVLFNYYISTFNFEITLLKIIIGSVMLIFVFIEINKNINAQQIHPKYLPIGAAISGFFGGLSGHQGALRSMFLIKSIPSKENFIATGIAIACLVDLTRIPMYSWYLRSTQLHANILQLSIVTIAAFLGAFLGNKFLKKIEISLVHKVVTSFLVFIAILLISGII